MTIEEIIRVTFEFGGEATKEVVVVFRDVFVLRIVSHFISIGGLALLEDLL